MEKHVNVFLHPQSWVSSTVDGELITAKTPLISPGCPAQSTKLAWCSAFPFPSNAHLSLAQLWRPIIVCPCPTSQQYNCVVCHCLQLFSATRLRLLCAAPVLLRVLFVPGAEAGNEKDPTTRKITASLEPLLDGYLCDLVLLLGRTKKSLCMYVYTHTLIYIYIYSPTSISIPQNWRDMNQKHTSFHILPFSDLISCIYFGHLFLMARFFIFMMSLFYNVHKLVRNLLWSPQKRFFAKFSSCTAQKPKGRSKVMNLCYFRGRCI